MRRHRSSVLRAWASLNQQVVPPILVLLVMECWRWPKAAWRAWLDMILSQLGRLRRIVVHGLLFSLCVHATAAPERGLERDVAWSKGEKRRTVR